jgi:hypothetical protein
MNKYWIVPVVAIVILVGTWTVPISTTTDTLPLSVNVTEERLIGVYMTNEGQREINFGTSFPGAVTTKTINLTRGNAPPAHVHVASTGQISPWLAFDKTDFLLQEPTRVNVTLTIPADAREGKYTGTVTIRYTVTYGRRFMSLF